MISVRMKSPGWGGIFMGISPPKFGFTHESLEFMRKGTAFHADCAYSNSDQFCLRRGASSHGVWLFCHTRIFPCHGKLIGSKRLNILPLTQEQTIRAAVSCTGKGLH